MPKTNCVEMLAALTAGSVAECPRNRWIKLDRKSAGRAKMYTAQTCFVLEYVG
jgi:hypothetical protein